MLKEYVFLILRNFLVCNFNIFQLISDAIRYGDCHKETMEMADYWLGEKQIVHKLFKVLVPRYKDCPVSYTRMIKAPNQYPGFK